MLLSLRPDEILVCLLVRGGGDGATVRPNENLVCHLIKGEGYGASRHAYLISRWGVTIRHERTRTSC